LPQYATDALRAATISALVVSFSASCVAGLFSPNAVEQKE
jgi:hypothetical protein